MTLKETMEEFSVSIMGQWHLSEKRYQEQKSKADNLEQLLTAIRYAMSADGIKDEKFYLNLGSAIEQTLKDYEN